MDVLKTVSRKCNFQERRGIFFFNQTYGEKTFQDIWIVEVLKGLLSRVTFNQGFPNVFGQGTIHTVGESSPRPLNYMFFFIKRRL